MLKKINWIRKKYFDFIIGFKKKEKFKLRITSLPCLNITNSHNKECVAPVLTQWRKTLIGKGKIEWQKRSRVARGIRRGKNERLACSSRRHIEHARQDKVLKARNRSSCSMKPKRRNWNVSDATQWSEAFNKMKDIFKESERRWNRLWDGLRREHKRVLDRRSNFFFWREN